MISQTITHIFESKKAFHRERAQAPFEEKLKQLVELQKLALEMKKASGRPIKSYETVWPI
jgi:hypothetical protein